MGYLLPWRSPSPQQAGVKPLSSTCWIHHLPEELLEMLFHLLPPRTLREVVQVCTRWRQVAEAPALWVSALVSVNRRNAGTVTELLAWGRLRLVGRLEVQVVSEHQGLREVDLGDQDLTTCSSSLLARLVTGMKVVWLRNSKLTQKQLEVMLSSVGEQDTRLKSLNMSGISLAAVQPAVLARVMRKVEEVWATGTGTTREQEVVILAHSLGSSTRQVLHADWGVGQGEVAGLWAWALLCRHQDNLAAVCDILGAGRRWQVDSIKMDNMDNKRMTGELMQLLSMYLQVEHLDLSFLSLAHLEADLLAEVTCQVEELRLTGTDLTTSQLQLLLTSISEDSKLRSLDLGENHMLAVDPNLLSQVRHLTSADLSFCQVTTAQMTSLLTAICQDSRLLHLSLSGCNLASVDTSVLASAVSTMQSFGLIRTQLSGQQLAQVLQVESETLVRVTLDMDTVDGLVLQEARQGREVVEVSRHQVETDMWSDSGRMVKILQECNLCS